MMRLSRFALALIPFVAGAAAPDASLYTTYTFSSDHHSVNWVTCGSVPGSSGCYGAGNLTGFQNACAMIAGRERVNGNTTDQEVYVFDNQSAAGSTNGLVLDDYRKTITVTGGFATTTFTSRHVVPVNLDPGAGTCLVAANTHYIFAALSSGYSAIEIAKEGFAQSGVGGFSPPEKVVAITPDERGYISVNYTDGFVLLGPDGSGQEDGGGQALLLNEQTGLTPPQ